MNIRAIIFFVAAFAFFAGYAQSTAKYQAPRAQTPPTIDGIGNDAIWARAQWYDVNYLWFGVQPSVTDFKGRFKLAWDANKLYVLAEIVDDVLNDHHANPLVNYWEDDTWEIFLDENASGGNHTYSHNAFAYHTSIFYDLADLDVDQQPKLFNNHGQVMRTNVGTTYIWEAAFDVYTDAYIFGAANNPKATLAVGKRMGFAMAYCDNDGGATRQSFIGSEDIPGTDKNIAWQNASVFGSLELVEEVQASFSHVRVSGTLTTPTAMAIAPDGRIFVCEQQGTLRVIDNGVQQAAPVLTVSVEASGFYTERGLIGVTVDPDFSTNNFIYIFYTTTQGGVHNRVSRFTLNGNQAVPGSEFVVLELDLLSTANNHNGGGLHFGFDGKLYVATGDNATPSHAQNFNNTHGKLIRINKDGTIPTDNPYQTNGEKARLFWSMGLRNPFTFDVQPGTGRIFVNDVGQEAWEEINDATIGGRNFGWPSQQGVTGVAPFTDPVYAYRHTLDQGIEDRGCAITGGTFFNPEATNYPTKYVGKFFFMDYCNNWIAVLDPQTGLRTETFARNAANAPIGIDVHPDGNLYYLSRTNGVYKIVYSGNLEPEILTQPLSQSIAESQPTVFSVQARGAIPLTYQWYFNNSQIIGATSATYTIPYTIPANAGEYHVVITNSYGTVMSEIRTLTVTPFNSRPEATIISPVHNSLFSGEEEITIMGDATDEEDGVLPASSFTWTVNLHHDDHVHDGVPVSGLKNFVFEVPSTGHTDVTIFYRIILTVTDAGGLRDTHYVDIQPRLVNLTLNSTPSGMKFELDGLLVETPHVFPSVVGVKRSISPVVPQAQAGKVYELDSWEHGGTPSQVVSTPTVATTYRATFRELPVSEIVKTPTHDAYVQTNTSWLPNGATTAFGVTNANELIGKTFNEGPNRFIYMTFDISNVLLAPNEQLVTSYLKLYGNVEDAPGEKTIGLAVYESNSALWNESAITFNNSPGYSTTHVLGTATVSGISPNNYYIDISTFVRNAVADGRQTISLVVANTGDNVLRTIFNSKEAPNNRPELFISVVNPTTVIFNPKNPSGNLTSANEFKIQPNPAEDRVELTINVNAEGLGVLSLCDLSGHVLGVQSTFLRMGENKTVYLLPKLVSSVYFIKMELPNKVLNSKLVVK